MIEYYSMQVKRYNYRNQRVSQEIQKEISIILQNKINDPRIGVLTISEVCVSRDLKNAKVFVSFLNKETCVEIDTAMMILQRAARSIRFLLAQAMYLRVVPMLCFQHDSSLVKGIKICNLIKKVTVIY